MCRIEVMEHSTAVWLLRIREYLGRGAGALTRSKEIPSPDIRDSPVLDDRNWYTLERLSYHSKIESLYVEN